MSEQETFNEKLGGASLEELEGIWKDALREFMDQIGVPERYAEAEGSVQRHASWTTLQTDWITLPQVVRQQRYGELRGRDARAPEVLAVECDKILIAKPVRTMASQPSVEGLLAYVISKRVIRTEEIALRLATT